MKSYPYRAIVEPAEEGGYSAHVPELPGCVSEGETYDEAVANIGQALALYLEVAMERGQLIAGTSHPRRGQSSRCKGNRLAPTPADRGDV